MYGTWDQKDTYNIVKSTKIKLLSVTFSKGWFSENELLVTGPLLINISKVLVLSNDSGLFIF